MPVAGAGPRPARSRTRPTTTYGSREGAMVDTVLGEDFHGIFASDFYAAYHHYPGLKQRCWAHLLREAHDLTRLYPDDAALTSWKEAVHRLYDAARAFRGPDERQRVVVQQQFEQRLEALCAPVVDDPVAVHAKLSRRMRRHLSELFVFVAHPEVWADRIARCATTETRHTRINHQRQGRR